MNKLYVVGPVGAWQDLTLRAQDVLRRACLVVACDEGRARLWLEQVGVQAPLVESRDPGAWAAVLSALSRGEVAWLVVELDEMAGPAHGLVRALLDRGVDLVSVPGASAMVAGLAASGLPADRFTALGLLPASATERSALWTRLVHEPLTIVCEVQGRDLRRVLTEAQAYLGDRRIAVGQAREIWRGRLSEGASLDWDGRISLVIEGAASEPDWTRERVLQEIRVLLEEGVSARDTARDVALRSGWHKRRVYELALLASRGEA